MRVGVGAQECTCWGHTAALVHARGWTPGRLGLLRNTLVAQRGPRLEAGSSSICGSAQREDCGRDTSALIQADRRPRPRGPAGDRAAAESSDATFSKACTYPRPPAPARTEGNTWPIVSPWDLGPLSRDAGAQGPMSAGRSADAPRRHRCRHSPRGSHGTAGAARTQSGNGRDLAMQSQELGGPVWGPGSSRGDQKRREGFLSSCGPKQEPPG